MQSAKMTNETAVSAYVIASVSPACDEPSRAATG